MILIKLLVVYYFILTIVALSMFGIDKNLAKKHRYRIPERALILVALSGGGIGALGGMFLFHHKTRKMKFRLMIPIAIIIHAILLTYLYPHLHV